MAKLIGIDLGTTNSCVAYMLGDKFEIIPNGDGERTTPSTVYIKGDEMLVGNLAKKKAILEPKNVIYETKRFIGMQYDEVKKETERVPYKTKKWKDGGVLVEVDGKDYKPEQIAAFVLKKLKEDAEKYLGTSVNSAVITVPAYFNDAQRNATKAAGEIAGLKVERIINEPTAASLCYGDKEKKDEKILVFDLGGGTFDVTVLEIGSEWTFQVLSTSGDVHLWGADFDEKIINELIEDFKKKEKLDIRVNAMAMQRIKEEAENAKKQLSQREKVDIQIPFLMTDATGTPKNLEYSLTRAHLEKLCDDLIHRCKEPVNQAIQDAKISKSDINQVILVGGSTRMTFVPRIIKEILGMDAKATVNPDEAVAAGAAIQAGIIQWDVKDILLLDVTPLSLGVEVEWGLANVMIARNTTIPAKKSQTYTNAMDNQPSATVHVTQWERKFARDNKSLGQFNIELPPKRRWEAQIEVTFDIDANGIMHVSAKELSTGKEQKITVTGATGISDEEIQKARAEADKFAEEDKKKSELVESKNRLEQIAYQLEKTRDENKDKLSDDDKKKIEEIIEEARNMKSKDDVTKEEVEEFTKKIETELQSIAGKVQQNPSGEPTPKSNNDSTVEWEVVDAN